MGDAAAETKPAFDLTRTDELPTLPAVALRVAQTMGSADVSILDVCEEIERDQAITAKVLKLVNSPFYGFTGRVTSIQRSLVLLGFNTVRSLVLGVSVFDGGSEKVRDLWLHALGVSTAAEAIARRLGMSDAEEIATAGLLHDIGKVAISAKRPALRDRIVALARESGASVLEAEREVLGIDHAAIGKAMAEQWKLPAAIAEVVAHHHAPDLAASAARQTSVVHVADAIVKGFGYGQFEGETVSRVSPTAWRLLGVEGSAVPALVETVAEPLRMLRAIPF